jgi:hypothetical protein
LGGPGQIAEDLLGEVMARAKRTHAELRISQRSGRLGPLDDCRFVAVSPDGEWVATGSQNLSAQVWHASEIRKEAEIPAECGTSVALARMENG